MQIREFDYKQSPIVLLADEDNTESVEGRTKDERNNLVLSLLLHLFK